MIRIKLSSIALCFCLMAILGCGPTLHKPSGKLVKGGQPLSLSDKGVIQMSLYPEADKAFGAGHGVDWKKDGTFTVSGNGVPSGKYRVSVAIMDPYDGPTSKDMLGGKMAREKGQVIEIKDSKEIVIDIDK